MSRYCDSDDYDFEPSHHLNRRRSVTDYQATLLFGAVVLAIIAWGAR
jgi:hypothetical protein